MVKEYIEIIRNEKMIREKMAKALLQKQMEKIRIAKLKRARLNRLNGSALDAIDEVRKKRQGKFKNVLKKLNSMIIKPNKNLGVDSS